MGSGSGVLKHRTTSPPLVRSAVKADLESKCNPLASERVFLEELDVFYQ